MKNILGKTGFASLIMIVAFVYLLPSVAQGQFRLPRERTRKARCDRGRSLQREIDRARITDTILVIGTCDENVTVPADKSDLTIDGEGTGKINGDSDSSTLNVRGTRITIKDLEITGGSNGIIVSGSVTIDGVLVQNTGNRGIVLNQNASGRIVNSTIQDNPGDGIVVDGNATARIGFLSGMRSATSF